MSDLNLATVNTTAALADLPAAYRRDIDRAYGALAALEPSAIRIRRAAQAVGTLRTRGASVRNVVKLLSLSGSGHLPTGKSTIERLGYVADAIGGEWPDMGDTADATLMHLYRIACIGRAADVARAAELGRAAATGDDAHAAVESIREELTRAQHRDIVAAPDRPVAGLARESGILPADDDTDDTDAPVTVASRPAVLPSSALAAASTLALMAELHKRITSRGFTPDTEIDDAMTALGVAYESVAGSVLADA